MNDTEKERANVKSCAGALARVARLIETAASLDLHPSLDWEQLIRFVNEEMMLGAENAMWDDTDNHKALYAKLKGTFVKASGA